LGGERERDKGLVLYMIFPIIFIFEQKKTDKKSCMPKCTGYKFMRPELAGRVESSERISRIIPV